MSIVRSFLAWLRGDQTETTERRPAPPPQERKPRHFAAVTVVHRAPSNAEVQDRVLYCVHTQSTPRWALFRCPCNCGQVITLSLLAAHKPHWRILRGPYGHPSLHPSIWRNTGCLSHFWIDDGQVIWCDDTGRHPDTRMYR